MPVNIENLKKKAKEIAEKLETITLIFEAKGSGNGRMFGTISPKQIEEELKTKYDIEIDKRKFVDKYPVDHFGYSKLKIDLYKGIIGTITILVNEK